MGRIASIVGGIGILIGIYLFLSHGSETTSIIRTMASSATAGIKTLQGR